MTTEKKKLAAVVLAIVLTVGVLFSAAASLITALSVGELKTAVSNAGLLESETQEDDVPIMGGEYRILSTTAISDAYKAGSTSGLDDKQKETLDMASAVLDEIITDSMSDYEKEKAVYDWMTSELRYDTGVLQVIPQTEADCDNPYGVLKYHNAVCVGYATTFRLFMQMMDIPCMVVHNTDKYHSWNLVKLGDDWYHVDIYSDQESGSYANFDMNDEQCTSNHDWDRTFFPAANGMEFNYAYQSRVPVEDIYQIPDMIRQALEDKKGISLSFEAIDEPRAEIVETMLNGIQDRISSGEYGDLWMHWSWMHITGSEYVLAVYIEGYEQDDDDTGYDISEEDLQKAEDAVENAFGGGIDWDHLEDGDTEAPADVVTTTNGMTVYRG